MEGLVIAIRDFECTGKGYSELEKHIFCHHMKVVKNISEQKSCWSMCEALVYDDKNYWLISNWHSTRSKAYKELITYLTEMNIRHSVVKERLTWDGIKFMNSVSVQCHPDFKNT